MPCCIQWLESEPRKGLNVNIAAAMASKDSDKQAILNALAFPRAGTQILQQEAQATHERTLELWSLFLNFYILSQSTRQPIEPVSRLCLQGSHTEAMRPWAVHWLGTLLWPICPSAFFFFHYLLEVFVVFASNLMLLWSPSCRFVASTSPQLRFSSVANGRDTSRSGVPTTVVPALGTHIPSRIAGTIYQSTHL